jgi:hypothetical protein
MVWSFLMFRLLKFTETKWRIDAEKYVAWGNKFLTVVPNICGVSARNLNVTLLMPRILTWFIGLGGGGEFVGSLITTTDLQ